MTDEEKVSKYIKYFPSIYQGVDEPSAFFGRFLKAFEKILSGIDDGFLFSWEKIPGSDEERLIEFLMQNYSIEWIQKAIIDKIGGVITVKSSYDNKYLSLALNEENTIVNLKIDDGRTDKFIVKMEKGERNLYEDRVKVDGEIIEGIEKKLDRIPAYFDPDTTPSDFLKWLAGWVALTLKEGEGWDEKKKRRLITQIVPLYKIRGTRRGLEEYIKIYVGEDVDVSIREFLQPFQINVASTVGVDTVIGEGRPYYFQVYMVLPAPDRVMLEKKKRALRDIINQEKPAHTYYDLIINVPTMQINVHSTIGVDTLLGGLIGEEEQ